MKNEQKEIPNGNKILSSNLQVINIKFRRLILAGMIVYTVLVLYFMFLGFHRTGDKIDYNDYTFLFVPDGVPLRFPQLTMSWLFDFGNIAAFIPFGIIIPLLYRIRFKKLLPLFILVITFLEVLQSLTFLGTFDVMDIISNTLGAIIGFVAYKVGVTTGITFKKLAASAATILILFLGIMTVSEAIDYSVHVNETIGPVQAINEISATAPVTEKISSFTVQGEKINPTLNLYSSTDETSKEYLFNVGKENPWIYANIGIPDGVEYKGSVTIMVNGEELFLFSDKDEDKNTCKVKTFYNAKLKDLKIIVTGNAKVWDVGIAEIMHWWQ
ncbi:VanZ family protein [Anaerocolumna sp. AGMB13020]|uniref:VanZ family protein n=1 Tax=Anaerocolumna sp. AGMB13020 TaxID=3081750 RepID=UPI0029550FF7|nr:VanZ family protein [Anaerocolumna sp. AGMB13020]WOO38010.1 VanZ family protein [Anaerocolumna sp. AGMB13020]